MPAEQPSPDALNAMREALEPRENESFHDRDTRIGDVCGYHLPALLDELERLREAEERRGRHLRGKLLAPLEEVTPLKGGYTLYRRPDGAGGRDYFSDEVGGGVHVWNTSLVSERPLRAALEAEWSLWMESYDGELPAALKAEGADGWRPIDPDKPETWPDQFDGDKNNEILAVTRHKCFYVAYRDGGRLFSGDAEEIGRLNRGDVTHYRELPAAPADGGRETK